MQNKIILSFDLTCIIHKINIDFIIIDSAGHR